MSIQTVLIHPVALLNVSDHVTRFSGSTVGILLGNIDGSVATINTSFETLIQNEQIDEAYLVSRYEQFATILPQHTLVGMYYITNTQAPPQVLNMIQGLTSQVFNFKSNFLKSKDMVVTVFNRQQLLKETGTSKLYQSYSFLDQKVIKTIISPNESESIATSTVLNHKLYLDSSRKGKSDYLNDTTVKQHTQDLAASAVQLKEKVFKIIKYLESVKTSNLDDRIKINNQISHLANKLNLLKTIGKEITDVDQVRLLLHTTELSLLTKELALIDSIKTAIDKKLLQNSQLWSE